MTSAAHDNQYQLAVKGKEVSLATVCGGKYYTHSPELIVPKSLTTLPCPALQLRLRDHHRTSLGNKCVDRSGAASVEADTGFVDFSSSSWLVNLFTVEASSISRARFTLTHA